MTGFPRPGKRRLIGGRAGLLLVGAALLLWLGAWPAAAQVNTGGSKQDKKPPVVFPADEVQNEKQLGLPDAKAHVESTHAGRVVATDTVGTNNPRTTYTPPA